MKEYPIIFNSEMVKAILDGRKTQTRRVIKPQIEQWKDCYAYQVKKDNNVGYPLVMRFNDLEEMNKYCPYGKVGDRLWVREGFGLLGRALSDGKPPDNEMSVICYRATDKNVVKHCIKWRPSIHMPRWASRITLEITDVRVERLQEITAKDCVTEGCSRTIESNPHYHPRDRFKDLWNSIHKKQYRWEDNPWVWVITFRRVNNEKVK